MCVSVGLSIAHRLRRPLKGLPLGPPSSQYRTQGVMYDTKTATANCHATWPQMHRACSPDSRPQTRKATGTIGQPPQNCCDARPPAARPPPTAMRQQKRLHTQRHATPAGRAHRREPRTPAERVGAVSCACGGSHGRIIVHGRVTAAAGSTKRPGRYEPGGTDA